MIPTKEEVVKKQEELRRQGLGSLVRYKEFSKWKAEKMKESKED